MSCVAPLARIRDSGSNYFIVQGCLQLSEMPGDPKTHHFIPEFYSKQWAHNGTIYSVRNVRERLYWRYYAPESIGAQLYLYGYDAEFKLRRRSQVEIDFFVSLDTRASQVLPKFFERQALSPTDRRNWAEFLLSMRLRTPEEIAKIKETGRLVLRKSSDELQSRYQEIREDWQPESLYDTAVGNIPGLSSSYGLTVLPSIISNSRFVQSILSWDWQIIRFERIRILFSDRPYISTAGLADPKCMIILPLSPTSIFLASPTGSWLPIPPDKHHKFGQQINRMVIRNAKQFAYSQFKYDAPASFFMKYLARS